MRIMNWYSIDAIDTAIKRTSKTLFKPFDFWKWIKLGIIIIFSGGGFSGFNFNPGTFNKPAADMNMDAPLTKGMPSTQEIIDQITQFWHQYQTYILIGLVIIIFITLLFTLISSIMQFVFVEALVTNKVTIIANFKKYLRPGFNLFIIQTILGLFFLSLFILAMLSVVLPMLQSPAIITFGSILSGIFWFMIVAIILALISGIIYSLINLSIPLVMYDQTGLIEAIKKILGRASADRKQIVVYWIMRALLWLVAAIIMGIAALIIFILLAIVIILVGLILYFILSSLGLGTGNILFWTVMIIYGLVALIPLIVLMLLVSVPVPVFMKSHMLIFLQSWYQDATIPFFDAKESREI
jgi:hypothetical protein